ncbi:MAG: type II toxin-antitoxin system VapC family toxin [Vicinamibacteria bacterium]
MIYLDSSVLAAYYCPEPLSTKAEQLIRSQTRPALSDLTEVELFSAVSRKTRVRELSRVDAERITSQFLAHLESNLYTRLALQRRHYQLAREWLGRFSKPLRTLDALHLAIAASEHLQLVTSDEGLARSGTRLAVSVVHLS